MPRPYKKSALITKQWDKLIKQAEQEAAIALMNNKKSKTRQSK